MRLPVLLVGFLVSCGGGTSNLLGDAGPDAHVLVDGSPPIDGAHDATLADAMVADSSSDALQPDGAIVDATLPDGAFPDGALPDAAFPDASFPDAATMVDAVAAPDAQACSSMYQGSIVLQSQLDVTLLSSYCGVTGDITINSPTLASVSLPTITTIGGKLLNNSAPNLTTLDLPALVTADSLVLVHDGGFYKLPVLSSLSVPNLTTITTTLYISRLPMMTNVSFPSLTYAGSVGLEAVVADLGALSTAGDFGLSYNVAYDVRSTEVDCHNLQHLSGVLRLDSTIDPISFPALTSVGGLLVAYTAAVSLPVLTVASSGVSVDFGPQTTLSIPLLATAPTVTLSVFPGSPPAAFDAPSLTSATVKLWQINPTFATIGLDLRSLVTGSIWIYNYNITKLDLSSLTTLTTPVPPISSSCGSLTPYGCSFYYSSNKTTTALAFPSLTSAQTMWIDGDSTVGPVSMPLLTSVGPMLEVNSVPSLSLPALTTVQGELDIGLAPGFAVDPRLASLDIGSLQRATTLQIHAAVPVLVPHLMTASPINLTGVKALDLTALQSGSFVLSSSTTPTLQLPSFVSGSIDVENNSALTSIALPAFAVGSELLVDQAPALQTVGAGSLTTLNGVYQITNAPALTTVTSPALATVTGNFSIYETSVTSLSYPNLRSVGSVLSIGSSTLPNPSLKTLAMPMLVQVGPTNSGTVEIRSSPQLPQCQADQINAHLVANGFFGFFTTSNLGTGTCP